MSNKEYEKKATTAEMVMVDFDTQVEKRKKSDGSSNGSYEGTNIIFKAFGKVNEKGFTTKTYEFKPELRAQLEAVNKPKALFTLNQYREVGGQFWNIDSVDVGHTAQEAPSKPSGGSSQAFNSGVNPAAVGQAINLAVDALGYKHGDLQDVNKVRKAIDWYKEVKELFTDNWEAADKEPSPPLSAKEDAQFEEDIPF